MHDNRASNVAPFQHKFNGDQAHTIRFIFALQEYAATSDFQSPNALFQAVYKNLSSPVQVGFAEDRSRIITEQKTTLTEQSTAEEKHAANTYSVQDMQKYFIQNYRPSINRAQIFGNLYKIRMRYNENPKAVLNRVKTAVSWAKRTIDLLNETTTLSKISRIQRHDITELLIKVFVIWNNTQKEGNQGAINRLIQKTFRAEELTYTTEDKYKQFDDAVKSVVNKVGGIYYAQDPNYRFKHYDKIRLPLWETPTHKPTPNKPSQPQSPRTPNRPRPKRPRPRDTHSYSRQPPYKRTKYNPSFTPNNTNPNIQCWRCGKRGHRYNSPCNSRRDINNVPLSQHERRNTYHMPFRRDFKQPQTPSQSPSNNPRSPPSNPRHPSSNKFKQKHASWRQYGVPPSKRPPSSSSNAPSPSNKPPAAPALHTMVAEIHKCAMADAHCDPDLLHSIQSLHSQLNPNGPQPRQQ